MSSSDFASLSIEEIAVINEKKLKIREEHSSYMAKHPELRQMLTAFVTSVMTDKPDNVVNYAKTFFTSYVPRTEKKITQPVVIAGPSGVGKGTLVGMLRKKYPSAFGFSVSHTTRNPRPGEENGIHYHFVPKEEMQKSVAEGRFIEFAEVHGNLYGTSFSSVRKVMEEGKICIIEVDIQGVKKIKASTLKPHYLWIAPPSIEDLEERLRGRKTENEETIRLRVANAKAEMDYAALPGSFDHAIVNDDLDRAFGELEKICGKLYPSHIQLS